MIQGKPVARRIDLAGILRQGLGGSEIFGTLVSDVSFRRAHVTAGRSCFDARGGNVDRASGERCRSVFFQKLLDHAFRLVVLAFAEVVVSNASLAVDEVVGRPILIVECLPDFVVAVDRNRDS